LSMMKSIFISFVTKSAPHLWDIWCAFGSVRLFFA